MPGHRGHISWGLVFGSALVVGLASTSAASQLPMVERVVQGGVILALAVIFALFPDVDIKSKGQLFFYRLFFAVDLALLVARRYDLAAYLGLLALLPVLSRHRGWTHSYLAMLLVPLPLALGPVYWQGHPTYEGVPYYLGAVAGYFSHLLADGMPFRRR